MSDEKQETRDDRLEATAKREKAQPGNAEAMREALSGLVKYLKKCASPTEKCKRCKYNGKTFRGEPCFWHVDCGIDDYDAKAGDDARLLLRKFKLLEALSSPPRNCDRFEDETDAQIAFLNEVWLISVTKETALDRDRFENWTDEMRSSYAKWLLAQAAERKGGDSR